METSTVATADLCKDDSAITMKEDMITKVNMTEAIA